MTAAFDEYLAFTRRLDAIVDERGECPEADALRDEMDVIWNRLTDEDVAALNAEYEYDR